MAEGKGGNLTEAEWETEGKYGYEIGEKKENVKENVTERENERDLEKEKECECLKMKVMNEVLNRTQKERVRKKK